MDDLEFQTRFKVGIGGQELWNLRKDTALKTAAGLVIVGRWMSDRNDLEGQTGEDIRAMGLLLQMAGELALASGRMLSEGEHYAGAALLRQIVEIEYLTWTFKEEHESVNAWLCSTHEQRMKVFSLAQLRRNSKGRFLSKDYQDHCENGGHPVPPGTVMLGGENIVFAQGMLFDLIMHSWRIWDQVFIWFTKLPNAQDIRIPDAARQIGPRLAEWGKRDPIYALCVKMYPETPVVH